MSNQKTYVVEHLDPECGPWSTLEYIAIAKESANAGAQFCLSLAPQGSDLPEALQNQEGIIIEYRSVEDVYQDRKARVCLLDPAAMDELSPADKDYFDIFLFGGILGLESVPNLRTAKERIHRETTRTRADDNRHRRPGHSYGYPGTKSVQLDPFILSNF
ncbi:MAG: hypothetical protein Q9184_004469 [Pyrenodesmia sp. 2 TL-2023]